MTMASELARFGVPVRIVDKAAHRTDKVEGSGYLEPYPRIA
jgi:hypothetical protein